MRRAWVLAAAIVALGLGAALFLRPDPSLAQQAERLHDVEPYAPEGLTLASWTRDAARLRAVFVGGSVRGEVELALKASDEEAAGWLRQRIEELTGREVSDSEAVDGYEPCERVSVLTTTCVGVDGHRTFEATTSLAAGVDEEFDTRLLIRVARKHWYRVMGSA